MAGTGRASWTRKNRSDPLGARRAVRQTRVNLPLQRCVFKNTSHGLNHQWSDLSLSGLCVCVLLLFHPRTPLPVFSAA